MSDPASILMVAVVGHTNAGKTSLMRTLSRDAGFGAVSPSPATTTEVESVKLLASGRAVAEFRDTPGLEDPIGLLEFIDGLRTDRRDDGPSLIERFLGRSEAEGPFTGEAKALRQARIADLVLYVLDARDPVLPRHTDELELLARCGRPVLPVMNFVVDEGSRTEEWRDALARLGLHATATFDTVVYDATDEQRLFEAMAVLASDHREALDLLTEDRRRMRERSITRASRAIADLLVDAASYVQPVAPSGAGSSEAVEDAETRLQEALRTHEALAHRAILAAFGFEDEDPEKVMLECTEGRLGIDLFSREALREAGLGAMAGAAGGAAGGAAIDLAVGGLSLGAAALIGAVLGGTLGSSATQGRRWIRRAQGANDLRAGDVVLRLMLARGVDLIGALTSRGHAHLESVRIRGRDLDPGFVEDVLAELGRARSNPSWSGVGRSPTNHAARGRQVQRVARRIRTHLEALVDEGG